MDLEGETVIKARTKGNVSNAVEKDIFKMIASNKQGTITRWMLGPLRIEAEVIGGQVRVLCKEQPIKQHRLTLLLSKPLPLQPLLISSPKHSMPISLRNCLRQEPQIATVLLIQERCITLHVIQACPELSAIGRKYRSYCW